MEKRQFTPEYKAKIVMEILREESQISEIGAREGIHRTQLQNWKKEFVENAAKVFAQNRIEKQAKQEARDALELKDELMKKVGLLTIENDWLKKNLPKYSDLIGKQNLVSKDDPLPVKRQCALLYNIPMK
jgi:transposase-like protein